MKFARKSLYTLRAYVIGALIVRASIPVVGNAANGGTAGHPILLVCGGFLRGITSMHVATREYFS